MNTQCTTETNQTIIQKIQQRLEKDHEAIINILKQYTHSDVRLVQNITSHLINKGGKKIRSNILLLLSHALEYRGSEHHELAVVIEMIHNATLLHDDVIDNSDLRRGQTTANHEFGNISSILVGDFLFSQAFTLLAQKANIAAMKILSQTTTVITEGEILQQQHRFDINISKEIYKNIIYGKTAALFECSSHLAALISTDDPHLRKACKLFGYHVGMAYQMRDDLLDYTTQANVMGKNPGDDLVEGRITLPIILTLQSAKPQDQELLKNLILQKSRSNIKKILDICHSYQGVEKTQQEIKNHVTAAKNTLSLLSQNLYTDCLHEIIDFITQREH